jgi:hypothetical protein
MRHYIEDNTPHYWVNLAMKQALKNVRLPKCVRDGKVKKINPNN